MSTPLVYELRKPDVIEEGKDYPALYLIHGMGSNEQDLLQLVQGLEETYFIFSVRGPIVQPPGFAFFTMEEFGKPHRDVFDQAITKLTSFIDYSCEKYPIDQMQLNLMGFSQGAILSMSLGLILDNRIKGIAALSGYIPDFIKQEHNNKDLHDLSIFISHGKQDPVLPFDWAPPSEQLFLRNGAEVVFKQYDSGHTVSQQNYQDLRAWFNNLR
ncbi:alpha/beta hydrolase [Oceanobacillus chungangensis]|uniref:Esterase n=1 Tax=Oceanobacillus chungangensis TaxID=1229152 RepID=A0A3D8PKZ0_9BACI|nr:dienelactone hydrolase family protein [Oceanobacillus chungangensis]RDW15898.1 esterase [Oceanobacillus chungangensis]